MSAYSWYSLFTYNYIHIYIHFFAFFIVFELLICFLKKENTTIFEFITCWIKNRTIKVIFAFFIFLIFSLSVLGSNPQTYILLGSKDIRFMPEGTYCYYVYATNENNKTYTLPANIKKYNENFYTVNNVYFNNGGYLYFGDSDYFEYSETAYEIDQNENFWDIELTNIKTVHKKVTETNPKNIKKLFLPFVEIFIMLIRTIMFAFNCKKEV